MTPRRWLEYLIAILAGNGIYFAVLHPSLPPALQHRLFGFDVGLVIDFACCVLVYGAIRLGTRHAHRLHTGDGYGFGKKKIRTSPNTKQ